MPPIDAKCLDCGATFPRAEAATAGPDDLACPACESGFVRGIPPQHSTLNAVATSRCRACGATFARADATTDVKGELACPACGERSTVEPLGATDGR